MKQLTVRGFDAELERHLRARAREKGWSLNRAALDLLRRGAGVGQSGASPLTVGPALDEFLGSWTADEAAQVLRATEVFEAVDQELWK